MITKKNKGDKMDIIELKKCIAENISYSFSRSSGPGGQNVNKVNTKVTARLRIENLSVLNIAEKMNVRKKLKNRINEADELIINVQDTRNQTKNRFIAIERLTQEVSLACKKEKKRKATKPGLQVKLKRLQHKRKRAQTKRDRQKPSNPGSVYPFLLSKQSIYSVIHFAAI